MVPGPVLVIEDDPDAREMLRAALELNGYAVIGVGDGVEGLKLMETARPQAAVIDIGLPGLTGHQIARRIRENPGSRSMLLVALTGRGLPGDVQDSIAAGFDHHFVKPVDLDALVRLLGPPPGATPAPAG